MTGPAFLLAVDPDEVLLGSGTEPDLAAEAREFSRSLAEGSGPVLAYLTDRHLQAILERVRAAGFPDPAFLVCDAWTTLYRRTGDTFRLDAEFRKQVAESFGSVDPSMLRHVLAQTFPELSPQEFDHQGEFKLAYYVEAWSHFQELIAALGQVLRHIDARVRMVFSLVPRDGRGSLVLVPGAISEDWVLDRLASETGLGARQIVYASSRRPSTEKPYACVVVGDEDREKETGKGSPRTDHAVYLATRARSAGVLEGCRVLGFLGGK